MPVGHLSIRIDSSRRDHHLWLNNGGVYWVHYTLHFDHRKRRVRRSLGTRDLERAIRLRDELFARIREHGEPVAPRRRDPGGPLCLAVAHSAGCAGWLPFLEEAARRKGETLVA